MKVGRVHIGANWTLPPAPSGLGVFVLPDVDIPVQYTDSEEVEIKKGSVTTIAGIFFAIYITII